MITIIQAEIILEYFKKNPHKDIPHFEIVDWVVAEYKKRTNKVFRDPDRQIRKFHQEGFLIKVKKGVYRYEPNFVSQRKLEDFSSGQKKLILERDGYRCVICGKGKKEGEELHIDHIKPKDKGGKAIIENGQTLCATHNFRKKNYKQTETAKKMFIHLHKLAKATDDKKVKNFCGDILKVFEMHDINGHIKWEK